jgi:dimethylamine/trimethylamine dehydrogenase
MILVTSRQPNSKVYFDLAGYNEEHLEQLPFSVTRIGDCLAPSTIAAAVYDGHRFARQLDEIIDVDDVPFRREYPVI